MTVRVAGGVATTDTVNISDSLNTGIAPLVSRLNPQTVVRSALSYTSNLPVERPGRALNSVRLRGFIPDYYYAMYLTPTVADFGPLVATKTLEIAAWNAYFEARTLVSVSGLPAGVTISGPEIGVPIPPQLEQPWVITATPTGAPVLDALVTFTFDNGETRSLRILATRTVPWPFAPNWREKVTERLTWNTDVMTSESQIEQRRAIRIAPRRQLETQHLLVGQARRMLDSMLYGWSNYQWIVPLWFEVQRTKLASDKGNQIVKCDTAGRDFKAGSFAMFVSDDGLINEALEIELVSSTEVHTVQPLKYNWPKGSRFIPAKRMQLVDFPTRTRLNDDMQLVDVLFENREPCDWPAALPSTLHRGYPVLDIRPNETRDITSQIMQMRATLDNTAAIPITQSISNRAVTALAYRYMLRGLASHTSWRTILYGFRGRQKAAYIPTYGTDMIPLLITGAVLTIENAGYVDYISGQLGRRDIRIQLDDGTVLYRRILSSIASESIEGAEALTLDVTLDPHTADEIVSICYMALMRLNQDTVEILHETDIEGAATISLTFMGVADDDV